MAKLIEEKKVETKRVEFSNPWQGSLNNYKILVTKKDVVKGNVFRELPIHVYEWIKKYKVTRDA